MRRNLQRSLAFKIQKLSNGFRGQQKEYLHKLRAQKEGALGQASRGMVVGWKKGGDLSPDTFLCVCVCVCPPQEQFAFLNKADADVITIKDNASDTGFSQAQVAVVENIDMIVNERCVAGCGLLASRLVPVLTHAHYLPTYMTTTTTPQGPGDPAHRAEHRGAGARDEAPGGPGDRPGHHPRPHRLQHGPGQQGCRLAGGLEQRRAGLVS